MKFLFNITFAFFLNLSRLFADYVSSTDCSRTFLGRLNSGFITHYNFPFNYRDNLTCTYTIYLDDSTNISSQTVCLTFYRFSLENSSPFCSFDYVEIGNPIPLKYCGSGLWQYGLEDRRTVYSNIWSNNLCWMINNSDTFSFNFFSDNTIEGNGFYAKFQVYDTALGFNNQPTFPFGQAPCNVSQNAWTCFNRRCISQTLLCNGINDCGDDSDETYAHARCKGENILACDFATFGSETLCGLSAEKWFLSTRLVVDDDVVGIILDHTTGKGDGYFLYMNSSSATIVSPAFDLNPNSSYCFTFWYFVYGSNDNSPLLDVYITSYEAYSRPEWNHAVAGKWSTGEIYVSGQSSIQAIFAVTLANGNSNVVALDDLSVIEGSCSGVDVSCNFETSVCGWTSMTQVSYKGGGTLEANKLWTRQRQTSVQMMWDQSSTDGSGYYLFVELPQPFDVVSTGSNAAILLSPPISSLPNQQKCLQFWYAVGNPASYGCNLLVALLEFDNTYVSNAVKQTAGGIAVWRQEMFEFEADGPYQILIIASSKSNQSCQFFVDQILLQDGSCKSDGGGCAAGQFRCKNGQCIEDFFVCDNTSHCQDGSDEEMNDTCQSLVTGVPPFLPSVAITAVSTLQLTLSMAKAPTTVAIVCDDDQFACTDGSCLTMTNRCDGTFNCADGADEWNCTAAAAAAGGRGGGVVTSISGSSTTMSMLCSDASLVLCASDGKCITLREFCDVYKDCGNDSEEISSRCFPAQLIGVGAVVGIVIGCFFCLLFILFGILLARRRYQRQEGGFSKASTRQSTSSGISSIFSTTSGTEKPDNPPVPAFPAALPSEAPVHRDPANCNNTTNSNTSALFFTSLVNESLAISSEALHENQHNTVAATIPKSCSSGTMTVSKPAEFTRNRHFYRSLPPVPASTHDTCIPPLLEAFLCQQSGRHRAPVSYRPTSGEEERDFNLETGSEHIYEEPTYVTRSTSGIFPIFYKSPIVLMTVEPNRETPFVRSSRQPVGNVVYPLPRLGTGNSAFSPVRPSSTDGAIRSNMICVTATPVHSQHSPVHFQQRPVVHTSNVPCSRSGMEQYSLERSEPDLVVGGGTGFTDSDIGGGLCLSTPVDLSEDDSGFGRHRGSSQDEADDIVNPSNRRRIHLDRRRRSSDDDPGFNSLSPQPNFAENWIPMNDESALTIRPSNVLQPQTNSGDAGSSLDCSLSELVPRSSASRFPAVPSNAFRKGVALGGFSSGTSV